MNEMHTPSTIQEVIEKCRHVSITLKSRTVFRYLGSSAVSKSLALAPPGRVNQAPGSNAT